MAAKKTYKFPIFDALPKISTKNTGYYDTFTEEHIKAFQPFVVMRWLTGCNYPNPVHNARQIFMINELVNPYVFELPNRVDNHHKKLLYNLMTLCTTGKHYKYSFPKKISTPSSSMPTVHAVVKQVFGYNNKDTEEAMKLISVDKLYEMAEDAGLQTGELKEVKKELKKRSK